MCTYKVRLSSSCECLHCSHTHTLTAYWEGSLSKYSLPLSSYAPSPTILLLLETFLELVLWNRFQWCHHIFWMSSASWNLRPFKAHFIFVNSGKSFRAKWGEQRGCSISIIDFWARNSSAGASSWWRIETLGQSSGLFLWTSACNHFNIST
jgi:hypothetical protein